jgi:hypothetical protein
MKRVVLWAVSFFAVLPLFADARYTAGTVFHDNLITLVADVDGDGLDDIVGCNIYLNRNGSFLPPIAVPQLSDYQHDRLLTAIDVNDDHFVDLIVGRTQDNSSLKEGLIRIYAGDGHGGFHESSSFMTLPLFWDRPVDFDGDGRVDLLRLGKGAKAGHSSIELLRNNGDGTFTASQTVEADENARGFLMADLDGDHRLDLVAVGDMNLIVWYGGGNGRFRPAVMRYMPFIGTFTVADVNGDGAADLVALSGMKTDRLIVVYGDGLGHFSGVASTEVPMLGGEGFAMAGKEIVLSRYDGTLVSYSAASGHLEKVGELATGFVNLSLMIARFQSPASADFLVGSQTLPTYEMQNTVMFGNVAQASLIDNPVRGRGARRAVARRASSSSGPADGKFQVTLTSPGLEPIIDTWHLEQEAIFVTQTSGRPDTRVDASTIENVLWIHLKNAQQTIEGFSTIAGDRITGTLRGFHGEKWDFTAVRQ